MRRDPIICMWLAAICFIALVVGPSAAIGQEKTTTPELQSYRVPPAIDRDRIAAIAEAVSFEEWTRTEFLRVAPLTNKSLLSRAELVTRESVAYTHILFGQKPWGKGTWSWDSLVESGESLTHRLDGQMLVEICLSPGARAAQEYLLVSLTENTMPTECLRDMYSRADRQEHLGNVALLTRSRDSDDIRVGFARDNVCVSVWANGNLAGEALPLARKIDALIVEQPVFTLEQIEKQRPSIILTAKLDENGMLPYNASAPGRKIVSVRAFVNGQSVAAKDGRIDLRGREGKAAIGVVVVTHDLLASLSELEVTLGQ